eukprot:304528-Rhodomonas_salina.3
MLAPRRAGPAIVALAVTLLRVLPPQASGYVACASRPISQPSLLRGVFQPLGLSALAPARVLLSFQVGAAAVPGQHSAARVSALAPARGAGVTVGGDKKKVSVRWGSTQNEK